MIKTSRPAPACPAFSSSTFLGPTFLGFLLLLLSAVLTPLGAIAAESLPFTLTADSISYTEHGQVIEASGHVDVESDRGQVIADRITYDIKQDTIAASGHVTYTTPEGATAKTERLELTGNMKSGTVAALLLNIKKDDPNGPRLTASGAEKGPNTVTLHDVTYTACPVDKPEDSPAWQIQSKRILYDMDKQTLTYNNSWLEVYGAPVLWLPWMRHSARTDKPTSGLLAPRFGHSTNRGDELTEAYYWRQDENHDATLRARYMSQRGTQLIGERRFENIHSSGELIGSILDDDSTGTLRSHLEGSAEYVFQPGERLGLNAQIASDDTYYDDYLGRNPNYLTSVAYYEDAKPLSYLAAYSTHYQDIRAGQDPAATPQPVGRFQFDKTIPLGRKNEQLYLSADALSLQRTIGASQNRLLTTAGWKHHVNLAAGQTVDMQAQIRGDMYNISGTSDGNWQGRVLPEASIFWRQPWRSPGGHHIVTPMAKLIVSPRGGNPSSLPNEDSVGYELDVSNLFENNRFAGFDRVESGPRFIYGLENAWYTGSRKLASFFFGQSYRRYSEDILPQLGGTSTRMSDWVGRVEFNPLRNLSLTNQFRLDNSNFQARRLDTNAFWGNYNRSYLSASHTFLDNGAAELNLNGRWKINPTWFLEGLAQRDLTSGGKLLKSAVTVGYNSCCYQVTFKVQRRGFNNLNVPPSTDYILNLELLTLGGGDN